MVIDELVVILGLDSSKFNEEQRDALQQFRRTQDAADQLGKGIEAQGAKISEVFSVARKGALGLIGAFVGGEAASFIDGVINMDAATGRFAKTIGVSVETLGLWQSMVRQIGGDAGSATSALSGISNAIQQFQHTGDMPAALGYLLNKTGGIQAAMTETPDQILRNIRAYFAREIAAGRESPASAANYLRQIPGMNEEMIQLLLRTNQQFADLEQKAKAVGTATQETAKASQELVDKFSLMTQAMERFGASLIPIVELLMKPLNQWTKKDVEAGLGWSNNLFDRGSYLDRLDRLLWGDHTMKDARERLAEGLRAGKRFDLGDSSSPSLAPGQRASAADRESWIRQIAAQFGIDPDVAMRVARSEGFGSFRSQFPGEKSYGDFQLHIGGGLGDAFRRDTGLDPSDPANERAMDEYALRWASRHGWSYFHGAARKGIDDFQGIGARTAAGARSSTHSTSHTTTNTTHINKVEVNAPNATDADDVAAHIGPAIKGAMITGPSVTGLA